MTDLPLPRKIRAVEATPGYRLAVAWEGGRPSVIDLSDMISRGGVFSALADEAAFSAVRVGEGGRVIEWPDPKDDLGHPVIEIDSIALAYRLQTQEDAGMHWPKRFLSRSGEGRRKRLCRGLRPNLISPAPLAAARASTSVILGYSVGNVDVRHWPRAGW